MAHFSVNSVCHNLLVGTSLTLTYKLQAPLHNYTAAKKKKRATTTPRDCFIISRWTTALDQNSTESLALVKASTVLMTERV